MYLQSGVDYYLVSLTGLTIICKSGTALLSANIKIKLLSYPDINKVNSMVASNMPLSDINEEICNKCILSILGYEDEVIDLNESPAGIVDTIATKIRLNSLLLIQNPEESYSTMLNSCSLYERMALIVAHYTNNTYEVVQELPIDELFKRYTLCSLAFRDVPAIEFEKEIESRVG